MNIKVETRIAFFYAIFGGLWILFSDTLLARLVPDYELYTKLQTYKGWFFVAASALLIFSLIKRETDRREEALSRFDFLSKHSRDIILFLRGEDGRIMDVNAAAVQAYGFSRDEMLTLTIRDLRAHETRDLTRMQMEQADTGGILFETVHRRKDGSTFPVEVSSQGATIGGVRTLVSIVRDVTERKQAEAALLHREHQLKRAQEMAHLGSWELNHVNHQLTWSDEVYHIFGLQPGGFEPSYEAFLDAVYPEDREAVDCAYSDSIREDRNSYEIEHRIIKKDSGEVRFVHEKCEHFRNESGQITHSIGMVHDITEQKQAQEQLLKTLEELKRSNAELEQFAYIASHDLQEPLRGVAGLAQLLQQRYQGKLDNQADEFISLIVEGTQRMQTLINDLLAYSRIERRGKSIQVTSVETALQASLKNLALAIQEYGVTITSEDMPTVKADATQLIQLFQNLIGNGIKFKSNRPAHIHVGVADAGECWQFSVADNGIGIEPQYFERIFQVFQRLHTRREYKGTGIGLAICKKIVERHGGQIWVESNPGKGSTFYFTLPKGS